MESNIRSSFIPQAPISAPSSGSRRERKGGADLALLISLVLFFASVVLAVGVFLYVQYLATAAESKRAQLQRAKEAFEPALIAELTRLDDRMKAADLVLSNHTSPSDIFTLLQQLTLQTVAFSSFSFVAQNEREMGITMQGVAQSVNSIALQADLLSRSGLVVNPIFSNINRTIEGVRFDFTASIDPAQLRYRAADVEVSSDTNQTPSGFAPFGPGSEAPSDGTSPPNL